MNEGRREQRADVLLPSETRLLRAAGLADRESALAAWAAFRRDVPEGQESLVEKRLLPFVCRNLRRVGQLKDEYLTRAYANSLGSNGRLLSEAGSALHALREASIPTMVLKGGALLVAHYRDLGARPMSDVDILVPYARIEDALDLLERLGWQGDQSRAWLKTEMHASPLMSPGGTGVDLHRHVTYEARFSGADDLFFESSVPWEVQGAQTRVMSAGAQLLHSVVHGLRWSIAPSSIWLLDAVTVVRGGGVHVEETLLLARRLRLEAALDTGLELVRATFGDEPALSALTQGLNARRLSTMEKLEQRFRVRPPGGFAGALPNLVFAFQRSHPTGQPDWSGFPPFLREAWQLAPNAPLLPLLFRKLFRWRARAGS
ncbi:MAG: nucleotidyltransferase family protein [Vicinamibacteria bacterium]